MSSSPAVPPGSATAPADPAADRPLRGATRSRAWRRVAHGLYVPGHLTGPGADLAAWQLLLPRGGAFTHLTAAGLWGWWLPPVPDDLPVLAAVQHEKSRPKRPGIRTTRHRVMPPVVDREGLRVTSASETLLACAADLGLLDLLVLVDAALAAGSCTEEEVRATARVRRRGAPALRAAVDLADGRAESAWETVLRLLHVVCEVDVVPQHEVRHHGVLLGRGDLWIRGTKTLQEYDGGDHLEATRHRDDLRRDRRLTGQGWRRNAYTSSDLVARAVTVLRDADLALGREHEPSRAREWHRLLAGSLFTPAGTARLRGRWGLGGES